MTWEEFQPYLKDLNGTAIVVVNREKINAIREEMNHADGWQPQDCIINTSGVKNACFMGYIGFVYRVPDPKGRGTLGKVPTVALEGRLIYSKDDVDRHITTGINIPIEAIEMIKK